MADGDKAEEKAAPASGGGANLFAYISFFVAALSLVASMYQGYLNTRYVELIQTSVSRAETARTCKDLIDAFFQFKFKTGQYVIVSDRERNPLAAPVLAAEADARNAVSRFAALGTYLANFQGEEKRVQYTMLSRELDRIVKTAAATAPGDAAKLYDKADDLFGVMNDDCVRSASMRF